MSAFELTLIAIGAVGLLIFMGLPPILIAGVAERRGRDPELWRLISLTIPLVPLLYLLSVPPLDGAKDDDLAGLP